MSEHEDPAAPPPVRYLELKAALLLALLVALIGGAALYLMYARGVFEQTQRLVLLVDDSEGVRVGMDMTFSGFPIGRVNRVELSLEGNARILIDVPKKDAHWLRTSSMFTLVRSLVGGATLRAYSGVLTDPPLPDGAERKVLVGDTAAELPIVVAAARELLGNLNQLTAQESSLAASLDNVKTLTEKMNGPQGAMGALLGNESDAKKITAALDRVNTLLARIDGMAAKADAQVLGPDGLVAGSRTTVTQLNAVLADARGTLKKVDAVLAEVQAVAGNAREATTDLGALRGEVDATVRKVESLVDEVNRKWPFARDTELKLK
jgi:phospholipid/cholesterol/gamma-HCH transport system substrate-binding protein